MMDRKNLLKAIFAIGQEVVGHLLLTVLLTLQADALIKEKRCITINELAESLRESEGCAVKIMDTLGYSKVCARWVPRQLTEAHKQSHLEACSELLEYCHSDKTFLQQIVTADETWVHHFEPESKRVSMEWCHPTSPCSKKFKSQQSAGKVMVTVFWDSVGVTLIDFPKEQQSIQMIWHCLTSICLGPS